MKIRGSPKITLQYTVSFSLPSSDEGSPKPLTRQMVIPDMTPKLVVKSNVALFSAGTVSWRYSELATMITKSTMTSIQQI